MAARQPRAWTAPPAIRASAGLHLGAALATLAAPAIWPWALGAVALNHAVLTAAGMIPRSALLGPNLRRLPPGRAARGEVVLTFDDGPDPMLTPRVLAMLAEARARASFFLIGERARRHPDLVHAILAAGHTVENHTDTHPTFFAALGMAGQRRQILSAQWSLREAGAEPRWFRPPMGLRSPLLDPVLAGLGLHHASWTWRSADAVLPDAGRILRRLRRVGAGDVVLLHDGTWRADATGQPPLLRVLPSLLERLRREGLRAVPLPPPEEIVPGPRP
ncbi:polysaccharide deacetylase family protein [Pseudoroseomonas ludipueritiae]|uniref:Chitooligosaccharide deacetylase n=1 Tax=Pseudoroseomonas ludipueritiae TaxID=198093 RepID=A0ABR7RES0_9PROT|nr:polysaccharide deacetylase family protein [Pseudoroseomonas ludipueritiae]MBC9180126.1 polysaccharide deacetylase family protein [Pseudoroseomonas ludipueritiae]